MTEATKVAKLDEALVSIVIPARNSEDCIKRSLLSILRQSYRSIEVLLVDDGSEDSTVQVARELNDQRVAVFQGGGRGVSHARNVGINASTGEYVMFVDADDELESGAVLSAVNLIEKHGSDMAIGGVQKVWPDGRQVSFAIAAKRPIGYYGSTISAVQEATIGYSSTLDPRLDSCLLTGCWGRIIRRSKLNGCRFDESLSVGEDTVFNIELLNICENIVITSEVWYRYLQNFSSTVNGYREHAFYEGASLMKALDAIADGELRNAIRRRSLFQLEGACRQRIAPGCPEDSLALKARAIRSELNKGYWSRYLSEGKRISGIGVKHRVFLFFAKWKMTRAMCLVIAFAYR